MNEQDAKSGLVAAGVYKDGRRLQDIAIEEAGAWSNREGHVVWIGMHEPSEALLGRVQKQFNLHNLAIEDARKTHHHPKVERYGEAIFIVIRTAQMKTGHVELGETHLFVGHGYIVSVRHGASVPYSEVRTRCESDPQSLSRGEDFILYAILDFIVDNFYPVIDELRAQVEKLEQTMLFEKARTSHIRRLYLLRRDLLRTRKAIAPLLDICARLQSGDVFPVCNEMKPLFRDITDHVRVLQEDVDSLREVLSFAFEANLLTAQSEQTVISRRLAAWAAILAVPTAIAGIYGMNFDNIPELHWRYGYYAVLGTIAAICGTLYAMFRRNQWL